MKLALYDMQDEYEHVYEKDKKGREVWKDCKPTGKQIPILTEDGKVLADFLREVYELEPKR